MLRLFKDHQAATAGALPMPQCWEFSSLCLGEFLRRLGRVDPHPAVLDLGVLCGGNIAFLGKRGCRVSVEGISAAGQTRPAPGKAARTKANGSREKPSPPPLTSTPPLSYPENSFGGVLAWDAISRLDFQEGVGFVESLRRLLQAGGVILAYFPGPPGNPNGSFNRYRIMAENRLAMEPAEENSLQHHVYQNRQIYSVFSRFDVVRLSHLKSGTREVLVTKSRGPRRV